MKLTRLLCSALIVAFIAAVAVPAVEKETELGNKMEKMNASWRKLRRQVADPAQNAASLELLAKMRGAIEGAERLTPDKASDLTPSAREKFQTDYVKGMKKLHGMFDALEADLKAGKNEEAGKVVGEIADYIKASHKDFRRPKQE